MENIILAMVLLTIFVICLFVLLLIEFKKIKELSNIIKMKDNDKDSTSDNTSKEIKSLYEKVNKNISENKTIIEGFRLNLNTVMQHNETMYTYAKNSFPSFNELREKLNNGQ